MTGSSCGCESGAQPAQQQFSPVPTEATPQAPAQPAAPTQPQTYYQPQEFNAWPAGVVNGHGNSAAGNWNNSWNGNWNGQIQQNRSNSQAVGNSFFQNSGYSQE